MVKRWRLLILSLILTGPFLAEARISFGLGGGIHFSNFRNEVPPVSWKDTYWQTHYHLRAFFEVPLNPDLALQGGVRFATLATRVDRRYLVLTSFGEEWYQDSLHGQCRYLFLPFMLKVGNQILPGSYFIVGPEFGWLVGAERWDARVGEKENMKERFKKMNILITAGLGYEKMWHQWSFFAAVHGAFGVSDIPRLGRWETPFQSVEIYLDIGFRYLL